MGNAQLAQAAQEQTVNASPPGAKAASPDVEASSVNRHNVLQPPPQQQQQQQRSPPGSGDGFSGTGEALESVMGLSAYIAEIQRLEALHQTKLAAVADMQQELRKAQAAGREETTQAVLENNATLSRYVAELEERNANELRALAELKRSHLAEQIASVDDILVERRLMLREDVTAEVLRDLECAWEGEEVELGRRLERQKDLELSISRSTHDKMLREFVARLGSEVQQAQSAVEETKRESRKRGSGGGIFAWLSPNKRGKADDDDDDDDDDDEDDHDEKA